MSRKSVVLFAMTVLVMAVAGLAFVYKMAEFAMTMIEDDVVGFGAVTVVTYLLGMLPILFMTLWAVFSGRFRDIEAPKYRMLELDEQIERGGELYAEVSRA
ncbi:MAG TPA: hypothetical protein VIS07_01000 [Candidatus Binatia bacterium]